MNKCGKYLKNYSLAILSLLLLTISNNSMALSRSESGPEKFFDQERIYGVIKNLQNIGERRSWEGQANTSSYIKSRLIEIGLEPQVDTYTFKSLEWDNIWVEFKGESGSGKKLLIIAHYDSTSRSLAANAPGADDNASGVSLLLEFAELLQGESLSHDVRLVFLSNEEHGLAGSRNYAKGLRAQNISVSAVMNIDIVGYGDPRAIFSKDLVNIIGLDLPIKRKVKMVFKMVHNFGISLINNGRNFKIEGRIKDKELYPASDGRPNRNFHDRVRWKFGDTCA